MNGLFNNVNRKSISTKIIPNTHVIISLINGLGDSFLALPVIRYIIQLFGSDFVTIWAPIDAIETVFYGLSCNFIPIHFDRYEDKPFFKEKEDLTRAISILKRKSPLIWIGLNAYYPLWSIENRLRDSLHLKAIWDFGNRPQMFSLPDNNRGFKKHMREQYFAVIGEPIDNIPSLGKPQVDERCRRKANALISKISDKFLGYITIHTDTNSEKSWTLSGWLELAHLFFEYKNLATVALGKPSKSLTQHNSHIFSVPADWHFQTALLEKSTTFVGIDSCWAHVADHLNIPGVVLFGKDSSIEVWGPRGCALRAILAPDGILSKIKPRQVFNKLLKICFDN